MHENSKAVLRSHRRKKEYHLTRMGGKCVRCGYNRCMDALDFHHVGKKTLEPTVMIRRHSVNDPCVIQELSQCIVLCANCHREVHSIETDLTLKELSNKNVPWKTCICETCLTEFKTASDEQKFCSPKCSHHSQRETNRPTKDVLLSDIREKPISVVAVKYNVSDNSVRKWCENYKIDYRTESPFSLSKKSTISTEL